MSDASDYAGRRSEDRFPVETLNRPFLATLESSSACFPYLLRDVSTNGVGIARSPEMRTVMPLTVGDAVNFHLPFRLSKAFYDQGTIRWIRKDEASGEEWSGAMLDKRVPLHYPIYVSFDTARITFKAEEHRMGSELGILRSILKDAVILKKGVKVYFGHLMPYFLRISDMDPDKFPNLKASFLLDVMKRLEGNIDELAKLAGRVAEPDYTLGHMAEEFDLKKFRKLVEPELEPEKFALKFDSRSVVPYLQSIKRLEHSLYANHNAVVLLSLYAEESSSALLK